MSIIVYPLLSIMFQMYFVLVKFMYQLDRLRSFLDVSVGVFLEEINIGIGRLS